MPYVVQFLDGEALTKGSKQRIFNTLPAAQAFCETDGLIPLSCIRV